MTIEALTSQEMLILVVGTIIVVMIIGLLFNTFIKLAVVAAICIFVFGVGFGWLPQRMEELRNGTTTPGTIANSLLPPDEIVTNTIGMYHRLYNVVTDPVFYQSIWDATTSVFNKVFLIFVPAPVDNAIVENPALNDLTNTVENTANIITP